MMDQKRAACLATEANFRSGDPHFTSKCLQSVWAVLSSLYDRDLPAGSYLLQHGIHDGISVQVMNSTDQSQQAYYDLHQEYSIDTNATAARDVSENWVALDPWTVLPVQRSLNRPPLTFEPTDSGTNCFTFPLNECMKSFFFPFVLVCGVSYHRYSFVCIPARWIGACKTKERSSSADEEPEEI